MGSSAKRRAATAAFTAFATAVTGLAVAAEASAATPSVGAAFVAPRAATTAVPDAATTSALTSTALDSADLDSTALDSAALTSSTLNPAALQAAIAERPGEAAAGAAAFVSSDGQTWRGTSGDAQTGQPVSPDAHFRIGSISKTFSAVVLLQLAAEHRVDLDQSVQHYLPGLLPSPTFQPITLRQLLNMTSGLPQIGDGGPSRTIDQTIAGRYQYQDFQQIIDSTLHPEGRPGPGPVFAPGTEQNYNSLNYRIIGLLIEHVTGHSFGDEVTARIVRPLHLTGTFVPQGDPWMPSPYLHGYLTGSQGTVTDVSDQGGDPSSMISTTGDLDHFITALFQGRLLPPAQLAQMFTLPRDAQGNLLLYTGDSGNCQTGPQKGLACLGLGIGTDTLPDGTVLWGKTGEDMGYFTAMFATRDLSHVGIVSTGVTDLAAEAGLENANRLAIAAFGS